MRCIPSLACADMLNLERDITQLVQSGAEQLHIDIMDGHYVPNLSLNLNHISSIRIKHQIAMDVHIMVDNPIDYISRLSKAGANAVAFHPKTTHFPLRVIDAIHQSGMEVGIVINPAEPPTDFKYLFKDIDYVLLMAVDPGFNGQSFLESTYLKINELVHIKTKDEYGFRIMVDGGIDRKNGKQCVQLGADDLIGGVFSIFLDDQTISEAWSDFHKCFKGVQDDK